MPMTIHQRGRWNWSRREIGHLQIDFSTNYSINAETNPIYDLDIQHQGTYGTDASLPSNSPTFRVPVISTIPLPKRSSFRCSLAKQETSIILDLSDTAFSTANLSSESQTGCWPPLTSTGVFLTVSINSNNENEILEEQDGCMPLSDT